MARNELGVNPEYQIPDELWERIKSLLPSPKAKKKPGRPRMDDGQAMTAIFYVLRMVVSGRHFQKLWST